VTRAQAALILGTSPTPTTDEVRAAYRAGVLKHHPDRGGDPAAFRSVAEAAAILLGEAEADGEPPPPGPRKTREQWMRDLDRVAAAVLESPHVTDILSAFCAPGTVSQIKAGASAYVLVSQGVSALLGKK